MERRGENFGNQPTAFALCLLLCCTELYTLAQQFATRSLSERDCSFNVSVSPSSPSCSFSSHQGASRLHLVPSHSGSKLDLPLHSIRPPLPNATLVPEETDLEGPNLCEWKCKSPQHIHPFPDAGLKRRSGGISEMEMEGLGLGVRQPDAPWAR